jgi:hypothetical protein
MGPQWYSRGPGQQSRRTDNTESRIIESFRINSVEPVRLITRAERTSATSQPPQLRHFTARFEPTNQAPPAANAQPDRARAHATGETLLPCRWRTAVKSLPQSRYKARRRAAFSSPCSAQKGNTALRKLLIILAIPLSAIVALLAASPQADAKTSRSWVTYDSAAASLDSYNASIAQWAFDPSTSYLDDSNDTGTTNPNPDGLTATPVDRFTSYATFEGDVTKIDKSVYKYVMYDNENWSYTPTIEQEYPVKYMHKFASLAHSHGFHVIFEPARDLAAVDLECPLQTGWNYQQWYVKCKIAQHVGADAKAGDELWVQNQALSTDLSGDDSSYNYMFDKACRQARGALAGMAVLAELSSNYGTVSQDYAAAQKVLNYTTCPGTGEYFTSMSASWFSAVLTDLKNGGY